MEPLVLIAFGARNEASNLPTFLEQIDNLGYPKERLRYAVVTGDSEDDTVDIVLDWLKTKQDVWWRHVTLDHLPLRKRMFTSTNYVRHYATAKLPNVETVGFMFHCDADVIGIPPETLKALVDLDVDVVAPYLYMSDENDPQNQFRGKKIFRDVWGYRFKHGPHPGLQFNPFVADYYKRNMDKDESIQADTERGLIPMLSVGANPVLIKREVLEEVWYDGLHATPGWCQKANESGYKIWSYPALECIHDWRKKDG